MAKKTCIFFIGFLILSLSKAQVPADSLIGIYKGMYYSRYDTSTVWLVDRPDSETITSIDTSLCIVYLKGCFTFGGGLTTFFSDYIYCSGSPNPQSGNPKFYASDSIVMIANNIPRPPPYSYTYTQRFFGKKVSGTLWVGIKELKLENEINLSPNPVIENLTIETSLKATIEISNIEGQIIKRFETKENKTNLDISEFAKGVYIVKITTDRGVAVKKFVKE